MSIRLNKAIRELNIGLQTAVEFLEKRQELGEVKGDPNFKLSDDQFKALEKEFKTDQAVKNDAAKIFQKKQKDKVRPKKTTEQKAETITKQEFPKFKPLGKIDLEQVNKPVAKTSAAPEEKKEDKKEAGVAESPKKEVKVETAPSKAEKPVEAEAAKQEKPQEKLVATDTKESPKKTEEVQKTETPKAETSKKEPMVETEQEEKKSENEMEAEDNGIFQTSNEKKMLNQPKVNILGKIDLSSINQSTRPKKKTKEERRKEREDKSAQNAQGKKKRVRINKERVDINAAANQQQGGKRSGKKNNNDNNAKNAAGGKKNRNRNQKPLEVDDEAVARQVKETLARLTSKSQNKKGAKYRKEKREAVQERLSAEAKAERKESKTLKLTEFVTVSELATMMNLPVTQVISTLMSVGIMVSINQRLDAETINLVADEFGFKTEYVSAEVQEAISEEADEETDLVSRAPIVTVMGHVDHGKTSLLDYIRKENVIAGESGGITQHIGAYGVRLESGERITFLDTPGHEAFTAMRARGTKVTDIAIIVVAADDDVMPQTKEAISHAQAAGVPIIFAINKIDKPNANPDKIKERLAGMNLLVEEWGGKIQSQDISAKKGIGVQELLEKVLLEAEVLELKANPNKAAIGTVVEAALDKGRGYVSTVLVENGTLHVGDYVLAGTNSGKIRAMHDERGKKVKEAGPSTPITILGLDGAPQAGDKFYVFEDEKEAKQIVAKRAQLQREQSVRTQRHITLDEIGRRIALGDFKQLNIILKGDVDGSVEALTDSFQKLSTEEIQISIIHKGVGAITESDVLLASASDAIIIGFNVRPMTNARALAEKESIDIRTYSIIYDAINDLKDAMEGMLSPVFKEEVTGTVEIRELFKISKVGTIAGCMVTDGKIYRSSKIRLIRDNVVIYTGELSSLKRFKDDVKEVSKGYDCGLQIKNYNDIHEGDVIEAYQEVAVKKKL